MPAYTADFCLPFFESTDSPCLNTGTVCDPSTLWCDFANLVEAQLNAVESILGRTVNALPIAFISYEPETPVVTLGEIPFDAVDIDTDQMVDLEIFSGVKPRRNGIYLIDAILNFNASTDDSRVGGYIKIGSETMPVLAVNSDRVATAIARGLAPHPDCDTRASIEWKFDDTSPIPRTISLISSIARPVTYASLSVYWHSEV